MLITGLCFERTQLRQKSVHPLESSQLWQQGYQLAQELAAPDLRYLHLLIAHTQISSSQLLAGIRAALPQQTVISGGVAGFNGDNPCS